MTKSIIWENTQTTKGELRAEPDGAQFVISDQPARKTAYTNKPLSTYGDTAIIADSPEQTDKVTLVSSLVAGDVENWTSLHYPVIDIDIPAALIPSSTPGHSHLYFAPKGGISHEKLVKLLRVMTECGIVEDGYTDAVQDQGCSFVRLPWVKKETNQDKEGKEK